LTNIKLLNYGRHLIDDDDIEAVIAALRSDLITQGPLVEQFENAIAEKVGASYAVAVTSGTAALHLACLAAGAGPKIHGLTSAMTFVATANALAYCGSSIGLCDIDEHTLGVSAKGVKAALKNCPNTKIIMPVHFAGLAADSKAIRETVGNDRIIIEDASHSFGATYSCGRPVGCGAYADMSIFSFHPVKPITTAEGGAIVTNNTNFAHQLKVLRTHGIERDTELMLDQKAAYENGKACPWYYEQQFLGLNYRMTDIQAALGLSQLKKLDQFISRRRNIAKKYDAAFSNLKNISRPQLDSEFCEHSGHHLYILEFDLKALNLSRTEVIEKFRNESIGTQVHYIPIYRQPYYKKKLGLKLKNFPETENYYRECLSIPIYPGMTDKNVSNVIEAVIRISMNE
jgi:perosamine synthetase